MDIKYRFSIKTMNAALIAKGPSFLHVDSEDSDQTGWMPRLIRVFAGCTVILLVCHQVAHMTMQGSPFQTLFFSFLKEISY